MEYKTERQNVENGSLTFAKVVSYNSSISMSSEMPLNFYQVLNLLHSYLPKYIDFWLPPRFTSSTPSLSSCINDFFWYLIMSSLYRSGTCMTGETSSLLSSPGNWKTSSLPCLITNSISFLYQPTRKDLRYWIMYWIK